MKKMLMGAYILFAILLMTAVKAEGKSEVVEEWSFLDYKIKIITKYETGSGLPGDKSADLLIFQNGQLIEEITGDDISLESLGYLRFYTNELKPYLIFKDQSLGTHSGPKIVGFSLKPTLKEIFEIHYGSLVNDGNGNYIKGGFDGDFGCWHECFGSSAFVPVEFTISANNKNSVDKLTFIAPSRGINEKDILISAKALYNDKTLWQIKRGPWSKTSNAFVPHYPGPITKEVVNLIYKGHPQLANKFLDLAWNPENPYKEEFKRDVKAVLQKSNVWKDLQAQGYKLPW